MMGWVGSGEDFCGLGWVQKFWVGLGFEKVTHDQLCGRQVRVEKTLSYTAVEEYEEQRLDSAKARRMPTEKSQSATVTTATSNV